jgi:tRNA nucleotidyltransferase (CCA-adding enzyme)
MLNLGYKQVGKDFPVFLHPQTKEEYALARVERKNGIGYTGFKFNTNGVSLKDDLSRRDLTINSMAMDENDCLIDYFGGKNDLENKILRHTSEAFIEDPVRILRIAKFRARLDNFGFKLSQQTLVLLKEMVKNGEVNNLISERVFTELNETLNYKNPSMFFKTLLECGAYEKIFNINTEKYPPNNDFKFLDNLQLPAEIKFAIWLNNYQLEDIKAVCKKLSVPKKYKELAVFGKGFFNVVKDFNKLSPELKIDFFNKTDSTRRIERFNKLLIIFKSLGLKTSKINIINQELKNIDISKLDKENIAIAVKNKRLDICKNLYKT